jgi:hypothetical protein
MSPSEMAVRALQTKEPRDGGLLGRLPVLQVEQPQMPMPPEPAPVFEPGSQLEAEYLAGQRGYARVMNTSERTALEIQRGREVSERYAKQQQQQTAAEAPIETVVVESYPIYAPPPANDPAEPQT